QLAARVGRRHLRATDLFHGQSLLTADAARGTEAPVPRGRLGWTRCRNPLGHPDRAGPWSPRPARSAFRHRKSGDVGSRATLGRAAGALCAVGGALRLAWNRGHNLVRRLGGAARRLDGGPPHRRAYLCPEYAQADSLALGAIAHLQ